MNMKFLFSLLLAGLAMAAPVVERGLTLVEARGNTIEPRQATQVQFNSISASGNGCPSGTWVTSIPLSRDVATIAFHQYIAAVPSPATRECTVSISLTYPSGCTSGSLRGTSHGFAQVNSGVTGRYTTSYTSSTGNNASPPDSVFSGPVWASGNAYTKIDIAPAKLINRSPGNAMVTATVSTKLTLTSGSGGMLTVDDITFQIINQSRNSNWQTCV